LKITGTGVDRIARQAAILTEDDALFQTFDYFDVCTDDFIYTPSGLIAGCQNPFLSLRELKRGIKKVDGADRQRCGGLNLDYEFESSCAREIKTGYIVNLGSGDYRAIRASAEGFNTFYVITANESLTKDDKFSICSTQGKIIFGEDGILKSCLVGEELPIQRPEGGRSGKS